MSRRPGLSARGFQLREGESPRANPEDLTVGQAGPERGPEEQLYCFACGSAITAARERIAVGGGHDHTFTNPAGHVFRVGCFRRAPGCAQAGELTGEYSWFAGYAWRYALCAGCRVHLGWVYQGPQPGFFGLILDRLLPGGASPTSSPSTS